MARGIKTIGLLRALLWASAWALSFGLALTWVPLSAVAAPAVNAMDPACAALGLPGWPSAPSATGDATGSRRAVTRLAGDILLCRKAFASRFDPVAKVPLWTVERLTKPQVRSAGKGSKRDHFREDEALGGHSPRLADYRGAEFDRGHMAPAEDADWDGAAYRETFLLSNVAPMVGRAMNRTLWADLEQLARDWAYCQGEVYVWTGPVLARPLASGQFIGPSRIAVPLRFYKIVYAPQSQQLLAFLADNRKYRNPAVVDFVVSVDEVEALTGLDFLSAVPDALEQKLESSAADAMRRVRKYQGDGPYCGFTRG